MNENNDTDFADMGRPMKDQNIETSIIDDFVEVPDIPMPTIVEVDTTDDTFEGAIKFAIVGVGQGGSRLAETFWKLGYRRVCIVNTAVQDMINIDIPVDNKLLIGSGGAGKDPVLARGLATNHFEDILDHMWRIFKAGYNRILVCLGSGGGTGAGMSPIIIEAAKELNISLSKNANDVGVLVALPTNAEGKKVAENTLVTVETLFSTDISPLIVLDNQRIKEIYPGLSVSNFWTTANQSVCSLFHLFNVIACKDSQYTSFDTKDYESILNSGVITFGAMPLLKYEEATDVSFAIRDNLRKNILAGGMDLSQGLVAGCIIIGGPEALDKLPQENLEHGFEQLSRILSEGSTVHRGIYKGNKEGLVVYTVIGGLDRPENRLNELKNIAGIVVE